jgi:hypothetical protein
VLTERNLLRHVTLTVARQCVALVWRRRRDTTLAFAVLASLKAKLISLCDLCCFVCCGLDTSTLLARCLSETTEFFFLAFLLDVGCLLLDLLSGVDSITQEPLANEESLLR